VHDDALAQRFEEQRPRLRGVAYRMLGSASDADDAVQEAWLRASRADVTAVDDLPAWLTTIVARICLNMLRSRRSRREEPLDVHPQDAVVAAAADPEAEAVLADSVGLAVLVVLGTLAPAERVAFVLHDMFDLPFDEIAPVVGRSTVATRQLASRARRRVKGAERPPANDLARQRRLVDGYVRAIRAGDLAALVALLDPSVVLRADLEALPPGVPAELRGAPAVARGAMASSNRARYAAVALLDGAVGVLMAPRGRLVLALAFTTSGDRIVGIDVIANRQRLKALELAVVDPEPVKT
jgi:RNA polymerase sigma factor (sigma-70 family)